LADGLTDNVGDGTALLKGDFPQRLMLLRLDRRE